MAAQQRIRLRRGHPLGQVREPAPVGLDAALERHAHEHAGVGGIKFVTVNVSSAQLRLTGFAPDVAESLARHGLPAARLVLEVTESVALTSDPETQATLAALRRLGVGIALDDFGTGWSSLSYLARTKVDLLKLDRAFLAGVESDPVQARLVAGVIGLADSLGIAVVAEGIESDEQLSRLVELGGHLGQGYLFGRPMDAEALAEGLDAATPAVRRGRLTLAS
jgi:EAL domain-containing protein (putative c-di-GMP-specific phosphodiesterase class I)